MSTISGLCNFRDTGGMPVRGGGTSRPHALFRSEALSTLDADGLQDLQGSPIRVVVDLRTETERHLAPDRLPTGRAFSTVDLSIMQGATSDLIAGVAGTPESAPTPEQITAAMSRLPELGDLYVDMLRGGADSFVRIARLIGASAGEEAPNAVLLHCTAGKDRTGVATALMLEAVGVERDAVIVDYAQSEKNLAGPWSDAMIGMIESYGIPVTPKLRTLATGTPASAIEQALAWTDAAGGAHEYLRSGGLSSAEFDALSRALIA
ncbi:tyrosine-protein phosphatase [Microbacterium sp. GXF6406]